jgi:hypothetical protein
MKKIMKRGFDTHTTYHRGSDQRTYHLDVWEQPLRRWLVAQIYHWYDMRIHKVPGFKLLERFLEWRYKGDPMLYLPLGAEQDCKCFYLTEKGRTVLASFEITKELRDQIWRQGSYYT